MSPFSVLSSFVDFLQPSLYICLVSISASPLVWNVVGQNEYKSLSETHRGARRGTILGVL
ncbi:hypothetical protein B0H11DRAFT_2021985, partial [Mycena galericulata]